jgi:putative glycosyltransferase (TIGR04372 family)
MKKTRSVLKRKLQEIAKTRRWHNRSISWFVRRACSKACGVCIALLLQPFALVAHCFGLRRVTISHRHIGHLASEPDCLLKLIQLELLPARHWFIVAPLTEVANVCLLDYWREHIIIVTNPILGYLLCKASLFGLMKFNISNFVMDEKKANTYYSVNHLWQGRPPIFSLSESHKDKGSAALHRLGLPPGAWFVCAHAREGGFTPDTEDVHSYRNTNIDQYRQAIKTIASHGGWVIRVGDASMKQLAGLPNLIDYAHSSEKADWMDLFLCAQCQFFLGDTSGLFMISVIFGVPCVLTNITPLGVPAYAPIDLYIPKLLCKKIGSDRLLFSDIFASPLSTFRATTQFTKAGVEHEENSSDDIDALVKEALLRMENKWVSRANDEELQASFKKMFRPEHPGYKSFSRIGADFIRKYQALWHEGKEDDINRI